MSHYLSNLRDVEFNLFELLGRETVLGSGPYADIDADTARTILTEVDTLARTKLAATFSDHDREQPVFDPAAHSVTMPTAFADSFRAWMDSDFFRLELPEEIGGTPAPPTLTWSVAELVLGANAPIYMYGAGPKFGHVVWEHGTARDHAIANHMTERKWGATMVLTEPDAGSDVGAGRTRATRNDDGTWNIEGVKRFITSGDQDMTENIIHLVLARPVGVDGAGGPGTKGLSLFVVPKHHFDVDTGELTGERNGVFVTGMEHKHGIRVSSTCEVTFGGHGVPARGWLLGEVHNGIAQMFQVIEHARMMVGTKAIATLSTGYLNALAYATTRVQGPDLARATDKTAPRVTIAHHPDVRRSLLTQKAFAEGMRSLVLYAASMQDTIAMAKHAGEADELTAKVNDLLLPIVKGYGSERSWALLGSESLQTFGGSGFLDDYPIEQYLRDAKIDTLYEGTTAIQGQDLFFRKIIRNNGEALEWLSQQISVWIAAESGDGRLKEERAQLQRALGDAGAMIEWAVTTLMSAQPGAPEGDPRNIYLVGLNTSRILMGLGDVIVGWLLLRGAEIALGRLGDELPASEQAFYEGKVAAARWFAATQLPKLTAERKICQGSTLDVMDLPESAF